MCALMVADPDDSYSPRHDGACPVLQLLWSRADAMCLLATLSVRDVQDWLH